MSLSRPLVAFLGVGILGIAGVGLGAGATFTDATHSLQTITAGSINVVLSAPVGALTNSDKTLTLPAMVAAGSSFASPATPITMTNIGTMPAKVGYLKVGLALPIGGTPAEIAANKQLRNSLSVCIWSPGDATGQQVEDLPVSTLNNLNSGLGLSLGGALAPGASDSYTAEFYVGEVPTKCGGNLGAPSLSNAAQGGSVTTSVNISYTE